MVFTDEELLLICRALSRFSTHADSNADCMAAEELSIRIYKEKFTIGGQNNA